MRFFLSVEKKMEKFGILNGYFSNPNPIWLTLPKQQKIDQTRVKKF